MAFLYQRSLGWVMIILSVFASLLAQRQVVWTSSVCVLSSLGAAAAACQIAACIPSFVERRFLTSRRAESCHACDLTSDNQTGIFSVLRAYRVHSCAPVVAK